MAKSKTPSGPGIESIALNKSKQSAFAKAVRRAKKSKLKNLPKPKKEQEEVEGVVIKLDHVPHGFYEKEIQSYFQQFGKVVRVRLARSSKTGKSRGYAFVQFEFEEVAKIAAEAMNNYLMFERLIKCKVLPSSVDIKKLFHHSFIKEDSYQKLKARNKVKANQKIRLTEEESDQFLQKRLEKIQTRNAKLQKLGVNYEFNLKPMDASERNSKAVGTPTQTGKKNKQTLSFKSNTFPLVSKTPKANKITSPKAATPEQKFVKIATPNAKSSGTPKKSTKLSTPTVQPAESPVVSKVVNVQNTPTGKSPMSNLKKPKAGLQTPVQSMPKGKLSVSLHMGKDTGKTPKSASATPKSNTTPITKKSPKDKQSLSPPIFPSQFFEEEEDNTQIFVAGQKGKKRAASDLPKISPKVLRTRDNDKKALKLNDDEDDKAEETPVKNNRKSVAPELKEMTPAKLKFSPKLLRSRKSQGLVAEKDKKTNTPVAKKAKVSDLPKISPKMLRSRKSEAVVVPPSSKTNPTPAKGKKASRKSVV